MYAYAYYTYGFVAYYIFAIEYADTKVKGDVKKSDTS